MLRISLLRQKEGQINLDHFYNIQKGFQNHRQCSKKAISISHGVLTIQAKNIVRVLRYYYADPIPLFNE